MASRIIVGLVVILAILQGLAPDAVPGGLVPLALVVLGLAYAAVAINAEDATAYLVVTLAVGAAAGANVLSHIQVIGGPLDAILDQASTALYAGVITVLLARRRLTASRVEARLSTVPVRFEGAWLARGNEGLGAIFLLGLSMGFLVFFPY